jgi:hypothetical protein
VPKEEMFLMISLSKKTEEKIVNDYNFCYFAQKLMILFMKAISYFLITTVLLIQSISSLQAQNTEGKEFWLTFGQLQTFLPNSSFIEIRIRIVNGNKPSTVTVYFTNLNASEQFNLNAYEVYTFSLNKPEYIKLKCGYVSKAMKQGRSSAP